MGRALACTLRLALLFVLVQSSCAPADPCEGQSGACLTVELTGVSGAVTSVQVDVGGGPVPVSVKAQVLDGDLPEVMAVPLPDALAQSTSVELTGLALRDKTLVGRGTATVNLMGTRNRATIALSATEQPTCSDGARDLDETDVDCGGACGPCGDGKRCAATKDCMSGVCADGQCGASTCTDQVKNGRETDTDCGGGVCLPCSGGQVCVENADCLSQLCNGGKCTTPSCADKTRNGLESDVDCGGGACMACDDNKRCSANSDCRSAVCASMVCQAATCTDKTKNGLESDTDCGGGVCPTCGDRKGCRVNGDCQSGVCTNNQCASPACSDKIKNGVETDVDCGGVDCPKCSDNLTCALPGDCVSGVCTGMKCQTATCNDKVQNSNETDVDCGGGTCATCAAMLKCKVPGDCQSGVCKNNLCAAPACNDTVKNGAETDTDCGGGTCLACGNNLGCAVNSDCQSLVCKGNICQPPTCMDGVKNGTETDIDCGGAGCQKCQGGQSCGAGTDCLLGVCTANKCSPVAWTQVYGNSVNVSGGLKSLSVDPSGAFVVAGSMGDSLQVNGTAYLGAVERYTQGGALIWSRRIGTSAYAATDSGNNAFVVGTFVNMTDFGDGKFLVPSASGDAFVAKYNSAGALQWVKTFTATTGMRAAVVAVDPNGDAVVAGTFNGTGNAGGGNLPTSGGVWFARYASATGAHMLSSSLAVTATVRGLAIRPNGDLALWLSSIQNNANFGGGAVANPNGQSYAVLLTLSSAGVYQRQRVYGAGATTVSYAAGGLTSDSAGELYVSGTVLSLGANNTPGNVGQVTAGQPGFTCYVGPFVGRYAGATSNHVWSACAASGGSGGAGLNLAVDGNQGVTLIGSLNGTVNLGTGAVTSARSSLLLARFAATGAIQTTRLTVPAVGGSLSGDAAAYDKAGGLGIAGVLGGSADLGGGTITAAGPFSFFLSRVNP